MAKFPKIKFVRVYHPSWRTWTDRKLIDIVYRSGRVRTVDENEIPIVIKDFLKVAEAREYYDAIFKRNEIIYKER